MKLASLRLRDRLDNALVSFKADRWSIDMEGGIVTLRSLDAGKDETYLVPLSNVVSMVPEKGTKK